MTTRPVLQYVSVIGKRSAMLVFCSASRNDTRSFLLRSCTIRGRSPPRPERQSIDGSSSRIIDGLAIRGASNRRHLLFAARGVTGTGCGAGCFRRGK